MTHFFENISSKLERTTGARSTCKTCWTYVKHMVSLMVFQLQDAIEWICRPDNTVDLNLFIFCQWSHIPKPSTYHLAHKNLCLSTDQQRPLPAHFQTPPRGGKSSYCPPEQTSEVANTMCEVVGGGERGPIGARAVLTRLKLVFPRFFYGCLSIAQPNSRQLKFL